MDPYIKYGQFKMDYKMYFETIAKIKPHMVEISEYFGIDYKDLRYHHYIEYAKSALEVEFVEYQFSSKLKGMLAGALYIKDDCIIIALNASLGKGRKNFTSLHEIKHLLIDVPLGISSQFNDHIGVSIENKPFIEIEADTISSYMMCSDATMIDAIYSGMSYKEMLREFGYSDKALEVRLINFLVFGAHETYQYAVSAVRNFKLKKCDLVESVDNALLLGYLV